MSTTDILREAEADLAALANLPGEIRDKVRAGVAEFTRLRDAIDAAIAGLTDGARNTLASLQAPSAQAPSATPAPAPEAAPAASFGA